MKENEAAIHLKEKEGSLNVFFVRITPFANESVCIKFLKIQICLHIFAYQIYSLGGKRVREEFIACVCTSNVMCVSKANHTLSGAAASVRGKQHKRHIRKREHKGLHQLSLSSFFPLFLKCWPLFPASQTSIKDFFLSQSLPNYDDRRRESFHNILPSFSLSPLDSLTILTPLCSECKCD